MREEIDYVTNQVQRVADISKISEQMTRAVLDVSKEKESILEITPKEGYLAMVEIIKNANDMSSNEKMKAISVAEKEYKASLEKSEIIVEKMLKNRATIAVSFLLAVIIGLSSKSGTKALVKLMSRK